MIAFYTDLDNTLIYSYKHDIGKEKKCVEIYEGREVSYVTDRTDALLKELLHRGCTRDGEELLWIPTTTRTVEQYERISFGTDVPHYALTCNGGVLLVNGIRDEAWYRESVRMAADSQVQLMKALDILETDEDRIMEVRFIEELFAFTKSASPEKTMETLKRQLSCEKVDVLQNGVKIYVLPKVLHKGVAVRRMRERIHPQSVVAAGDSLFDESMLLEADRAFLPKSLQEQLSGGSSGNIGRKLEVCGENQLFSEFILERL